MFEDKRLEKKLHHLNEEYNKIDTASDSEKILYHILNEGDQPKKKEKKKYPFTYVASLAAVLLIGVFVGLSSLLDDNVGNKSYDESLALEDSQGPSEEGPADGYSSGGRNDDDEQESADADQGQGMSKEEFIKKQEEEEAKYEEENKQYYVVFEDHINALYDKASEMLGMTQDKLNDLYSIEVLKLIIVNEYRNSEEENKFEITSAKLEAFIANTNYIYGNELFEKMEPATLDIYDEYKASGYDDEVLRGLKPFEVMALYLYSSAFGDDELQWHLLIKSGNHYYPTLDEYDDGQEITEEQQESRRQFMESIYMMEQIVYTFESQIREHEETDTADIFLHKGDNFAEREDMMGFSLSKNDNGIWKVNFMPMQ